MGGSWIHHPVGNPLRAFADEVGVSCARANPLPEMAAFDCIEGRRLAPLEARASVRMFYEEFPGAVRRLRGDLGPTVSAGRAIDDFVAGSDLPPGAARRARQGLRAVVEAEAADLAENQSLKWMGNEQDYGGDYFGDVPAGGYRSLLSPMAAGLEVRTGVEVAEIVLGGDGVTILGAGGDVEEGSHVVVTVPLGVLDAERPGSRPACRLTARRR